MARNEMELAEEIIRGDAIVITREVFDSAIRDDDKEQVFHGATNDEVWELLIATLTSKKGLDSIIDHICGGQYDYLLEN